MSKLPDGEYRIAVVDGAVIAAPRVLSAIVKSLRLKEDAAAELERQAKQLDRGLSPDRRAIHWPLADIDDGQNTQKEAPPRPPPTTVPSAGVPRQDKGRKP